LIKTIFWDFDGVILDSMPIRDFGFVKIFEDFDKELVDKLLEYHTLNGGLSRYVKIRYFYNTLLNVEVSDEKAVCKRQPWQIYGGCHKNAGSDH
jgi:beta-phosphoglucomutase-like phosphatase (HAD superfamily)